MSLTNSNNGNTTDATDYDDIDDILSEVDKLRLFSLSSSNGNSTRKEEKNATNYENNENNNSDKKLNFGENLSKSIINNRLKKREELANKNKKGEKVLYKNFINFKKYSTEEEYKIKFTEIGNSIMDSILFEE